jgi:hypothetical protein
MFSRKWLTPSLCSHLDPLETQKSRQKRPYVPNWIGEVYEAELDASEYSLLEELRRLPHGPGINPGLLERYPTRDGSLAVRKTCPRRTG